MKGTVKSKQEIAKETLKVTFEVNEPFTFKPGQYCFITLGKLKVSDVRGPKRHFSIVNSPNEKGIITFTTRETDSGFKKTLKQLPVGAEVQLGPIAGIFTLPQDSSRPLVFIAGGIGITPFISMLRYVKEEGLPYNITVVYSNRDQGSTAYFDEIQSFKSILTMTEDPNWAGEKRKIDASFIKEYFPDVNAQNYMVAGPPGMVDAVEKALLETEVLPENIRCENFTGY